MNIPFVKRHPPFFEKELRKVARRTIRLGKDHNFLFCHARVVCKSPQILRQLLRTTSTIRQRTIYDSISSISVVIFAVFCSIAETEQYFSSDRRTASSTDFRETLPPTL